MGEKEAVLCQKLGERVCQFCGRPFDKEEKEEGGEIGGLAIFCMSL